MSGLLTDELREALPRLREQDGSADPVVHAVFFFPLSGWKWFVTEGEPRDDDFIFFGNVTGLEAEFGYFALNELEGVNIDGFKVECVEDFRPAPLKQCLELNSDRSKTSG
ncbi:MAG TPA: DUF2958 domain-containing protein [Pyrinomonadaceae bacterium]|nr:DUF2958 domain-containing protein [Pyrinomonadaceae bacterium]